MSAAVFEERVDPGRAASAVLAVLVHAALFAVLVFGVRWQNRPPVSVVAEIWTEPVPVEVEPKPEPKPEPAPVAQPEPVIEKPDIVVKKEPEKPKPAVKPEPPRPRIDEARKRMLEEVAREQASMERQRLQEDLQSAARNRALAAWTDKIRLSIRNRIRSDVAQAAPEKVEAVFDVTLLPTGEVLNFQKRKSSGHPAYDDELERALSFFKNTPLPKPDRPELFTRDLRLTFRPKD